MTTIKTVNRTDIFVGERFREDMGDVSDLARSIKQNGLIQPLAVRISENGSSYELVAGGRRMAAIDELGLSELPVRIFNQNLSNEQSRSLELEENIQRKDLTWIEQCRLQREIHNLRTKIYGEKQNSMDKNGWSLSDTARLMQQDQGGVSKNIQLADAVDQFDDIEWSKCKNKHEASKKLQQLQEQTVRHELAKRAEQEINSNAENCEDDNSLVKQKISDSYILVDAIEGLKKLESEIANLIEIDPPYSIDLQNSKHQAGVRAEKIKNYNEIEATGYEQFLNELLQESYRVLKPDSWLLLWFAPEPWYQQVYNAITNSGFHTTRLTGKWIKPGGQSCQPNYYLANSCEEFFYCWKGRPAIAKPGTSNVFNVKPINPQNKTHPTERPLSLMQEIIETFSFENDQIIVPCCGSGNTILASYLSKRKAFGYDISSEHKESFVINVNDSF